MKLYHASKQKFNVIKRNQVDVPDNVKVPEAELQDAIYLTPHISFAIAMVAGPNGMTKLEADQISFENEADFNPEKTVYVYEVDLCQIPTESIQKVDDDQYVVDMDELVPVRIQTFFAKDVFKYYKQVPWAKI